MKKPRSAACALGAALILLPALGLVSGGFGADMDLMPIIDPHDVATDIALLGFVAIAVLMTVRAVSKRPMAADGPASGRSLWRWGACAMGVTQPDAGGRASPRKAAANDSSSPRKEAAAPQRDVSGGPAARALPVQPRCRFCGAPLTRTMVDLGAQPLSNSYLSPAQMMGPQPTWPLHAFVCESCLLVQIPASEAPEKIFSDYAYFSSYSEGWLRHCERYADDIIKRLSLGRDSQVIEIASNDGYLLQYFKRRDVPVLGIEPAANVARAAIDRGIPSRVFFLNTSTARQLAREGYTADLLIGNNVLAHVPTLNDFVDALRILLKPDGTLTMEFPHLERLIEETQFDTIYHEHFSYFSMLAVQKVFAAHRLRIFDVDCVPTHGGSLRIYAARVERGDSVSPRVHAVLMRERQSGLDRLETYDRFAARVAKVKRRLVMFLLDAKEQGKAVVGYGAAAKGNTLLNFCGMRSDIVDYVVDANPAKQGTFLPGTRIPVVAPDRIRETKPDYVLILPWNLKEEIVAGQGYIREWGGRFVVPLPELTVIP